MGGLVQKLIWYLQITVNYVELLDDFMINRILMDTGADYHSTYIHDLPYASVLIGNSNKKLIRREENVLITHWWNY